MLERPSFSLITPELYDSCQSSSFLNSKMKVYFEFSELLRSPKRINSADVNFCLTILLEDKYYEDLLAKFLFFYSENVELTEKWSIAELICYLFNKEKNHQIIKLIFESLNKHAESNMSHANIEVKTIFERHYTSLSSLELVVNYNKTSPESRILLIKERCLNKLIKNIIYNVKNTNTANLKHTFTLLLLLDEIDEFKLLNSLVVRFFQCGNSFGSKMSRQQFEMNYIDYILPSGEFFQSITKKYESQFIDSYFSAREYLDKSLKGDVQKNLFSVIGPRFCCDNQSIFGFTYLLMYRNDKINPIVDPTNVKLKHLVTFNLQPARNLKTKSSTGVVKIPNQLSLEFNSDELSLTNVEEIVSIEPNNVASLIDFDWSNSNFDTYNAALIKSNLWSILGQKYKIYPVVNQDTLHPIYSGASKEAVLSNLLDLLSNSDHDVFQQVYKYIEKIYFPTIDDLDPDLARKMLATLLSKTDPILNAHILNKIPSLSNDSIIALFLPDVNNSCSPWLKQVSSRMIFELYNQIDIFSETNTNLFKLFSCYLMTVTYEQNNEKNLTRLLASNSRLIAALKDLPTKPVVSSIAEAILEVKEERRLVKKNDSNSCSLENISNENIHIQIKLLDAQLNNSLIYHNWDGLSDRLINHLMDLFRRSNDPNDKVYLYGLLIKTSWFYRRLNEIDLVDLRRFFHLAAQESVFKLEEKNYKSEIRLIREIVFNAFSSEGNEINKIIAANILISAQQDKNCVLRWEDLRFFKRYTGLKYYLSKELNLFLTDILVDYSVRQEYIDNFKSPGRLDGNQAYCNPGFSYRYPSIAAAILLENRMDYLSPISSPPIVNNIIEQSLPERFCFQPMLINYRDLKERQRENINLINLMLINANVRVKVDESFVENFFKEFNLVNNLNELFCTYLCKQLLSSDDMDSLYNFVDYLELKTNGSFEKPCKALANSIEVNYKACVTQKHLADFYELINRTNKFHQHAFFIRMLFMTCYKQNDKSFVLLKKMASNSDLIESLSFYKQHLDSEDYSLTFANRLYSYDKARQILSLSKFIDNPKFWQSFHLRPFFSLYDDSNILDELKKFEKIGDDEVRNKFQSIESDDFIKIRDYSDVSVSEIKRIVAYAFGEETTPRRRIICANLLLICNFDNDYNYIPKWTDLDELAKYPLIKEAIIEEVTATLNNKRLSQRQRLTYKENFLKRTLRTIVQTPNKKINSTTYSYYSLGAAILFKNRKSHFMSKKEPESIKRVRKIVVPADEKESHEVGIRFNAFKLPTSNRVLISDEFLELVKLNYFDEEFISRHFSSLFLLLGKCTLNDLEICIKCLITKDVQQAILIKLIHSYAKQILNVDLGNNVTNYTKLMSALTANDRALPVLKRLLTSIRELLDAQQITDSVLLGFGFLEGQNGYCTSVDVIKSKHNLLLEDKKVPNSHDESSLMLLFAFQPTDNEELNYVSECLLYLSVLWLNKPLELLERADGRAYAIFLNQLYISIGEQTIAKSCYVVLRTIFNNNQSPNICFQLIPQKQRAQFVKDFITEAEKAETKFPQSIIKSAKELNLAEPTLQNDQNIFSRSVVSKQLLFSHKKSFLANRAPEKTEQQLQKGQETFFEL